MEYKEEINIKLGENNVNMLLEEIIGGRIEEQHVQLLALNMSPNVYGLYKKEKGKHNLSHLMKLMLDQWYVSVLYENDLDGFSELVRVLNMKEVELAYLAQEMKREIQELHINLLDSHIKVNVKDLNIAPNANSGSTDFMLPLLPDKMEEREDREKAIESVELPSDPSTSFEENCNQEEINAGSHLNDDPSTSCMPIIRYTKHQVFCFLRLVIALGIGIGLLFLRYDIKKVRICKNDKNPLEENTTRTITFNKGKVEELHKCLTKQSIIPDLPVELVDSVGIFTEKLGILVCGGKDVGENPSPDQPKRCYTFKLGGATWKDFYGLNTNRIRAYIKTSGNKIFIIGGHSSDPVHDGCYPSQEVLDLNAVIYGWKETEGEGFCSPKQNLEVPCL